ncbi:hypothetical protein KW785_02255 [Candidatus Parcubacteria bacterium]|nr:hypothetical protein [Candidatus Parcubacteria bacterium]
MHGKNELALQTEVNSSVCLDQFAECMVMHQQRLVEKVMQAGLNDQLTVRGEIGQDGRPRILIQANGREDLQIVIRPAPTDSPRLLEACFGIESASKFIWIYDEDSPSVADHLGAFITDRGPYSKFDKVERGFLAIPSPVS